jgi:hypothetical protein
VVKNKNMNEQNNKADSLKEKMGVVRAHYVGEIFSLYEALPLLVQKFKDEGISEDQVIGKIGTILENILGDFEKDQLPLTFELIKELKQETITATKSSIISPLTYQPVQKSNLIIS